VFARLCRVIVRVLWVLLRRVIIAALRAVLCVPPPPEREVQPTNAAVDPDAYKLVFDEAVRAISRPRVAASMSCGAGRES